MRRPLHLLAGLRTAHVAFKPQAGGQPSLQRAQARQRRCCLCRALSGVCVVCHGSKVHGVPSELLVWMPSTPRYMSTPCTAQMSTCDERTTGHCVFQEPVPKHTIKSATMFGYTVHQQISGYRCRFACFAGLPPPPPRPPPRPACCCGCRCRRCLPLAGSSPSSKPPPSAKSFSIISA